MRILQLILYTLFSFTEDLEECFLHFILFYVYIAHICSSGLSIPCKRKGRSVSYCDKNISIANSEISCLC